MSEIHQITIILETTGKRIPIKVLGGTVTGQELFSTLLGKIDLPVGSHGVLIRATTHKQIELKKTLDSQGVEDEEILIADFERGAGGGVIISSYRDVQIIDTYLNKYHSYSYAFSAIFLYTSADKNLSDFMKENFLELHHLAGHQFIFYVLERPDPKWIPTMQAGLDDNIRPHINRVWQVLNSEEFSPANTQEVYSIAQKLGVASSQLPCMCFFGSLESKEMLVLPLASLFDKPIGSVSNQEFLELFRDLFSRVSSVSNYRQEERLNQMKKELASIKNGKAIKILESTILPEAIKSLVGTIVKLLIA